MLQLVVPPTQLQLGGSTKLQIQIHLLGSYGPSGQKLVHVGGQPEDELEEDELEEDELEEDELEEDELEDELVPAISGQSAIKI